MYGGACFGQYMPINVLLAFPSCCNLSYLSHTVASHSHTQSAKVHNSERTLSDEDIRSFVRNEV